MRYAKRVEREIQQGLCDPATTDDAVEDLLDEDSDCDGRDIDPFTRRTLVV